MSTFLDHMAADRRLVILRLLIEARGEAGESVLEKGLHMLGHRAGVTRDQVRADLRYLAERDAIVIEFFQDKVMIAAITRRGADCANGHVVIDGVAQPAIGR